MKRFLILLSTIAVVSTLFSCDFASAAKTKRPNPTPNPAAPKGDKPGDPPSPTKPPGPKDPIQLKVYDSNRKLVKIIYF